MPEQNAYDSLLQNDTAQRVRVNMMDAVDKQPDTEAKLQGLAKTYNMPVDAVRLRQAEIERQARLDALDYDTLANRYPKTANVLANPNAAAIAHDDVDNMSNLEYWAKYLFSHPDAKNTLAGDAGAFVHQANRGAAGVFQAATEAAAVPFDFLEQFTGMGGNPLRRLSEGFAAMGSYSGGRARELSPPQSDVFRAGVSSGIQSFGQNAMVLPLALLPGGQAAALSMMSAQTGGQSYQDAREKGVDQWTALQFGASQAAIEYATEKLPLSKLIGDVTQGAPLIKSLLHNAALEIPGEQIATVLQDMNEWAVLHPEKAFSDYLAERPSAAAQTLIATLIGVGGNVTLTTALQKAADNAAGTQRTAQQAEAHAQVLGELLKLAEASKVRERDPAQFAQFMQSVVEEGVPHLYVDANALAKSVDLNAVAMALPSVAEQITQAMATGGDVVIPTQELLTAGPGNEFMQSLLDNARTAPEAPSPTEAREYMRTNGDQIKADIEKALAEHEQDQTWRKMRDDLRAEFKTQLDQANRFTSDVNNQYATLPANFYSVTAAKLGISPQELAQRYGLRVQAKEVQGGQQLDQQAPDLVVTHNLTAANLLHAKKMGGIAVPSLAVTKKDAPLTGFGEITLIGDRNLVDPKGYAKTKVFGADIYSPRYPSVERDLDAKATAAFRKKFGPVAASMGEQLPDTSDLQRKSLNDFERDPVFMAGFLQDRGATPSVVMRKGMDDARRARLEQFGMGAYLDKTSIFDLIHDKQFIDAAVAEVIAAYEEKGIAEKRPGMMSKLRGDAETREAFARETANQIVADARQRNNPQIDKYETQKSLDAQIDEAGQRQAFQQFVAEQLDTMTKGERIPQGFTNSGNKKYVPHTLENVVKILKKELRGGESFNYGVGSLRAKFTPEFKTIAQIKKEKGRLVDKVQFEKVKAEIDAEFRSVLEAMRTEDNGSVRDETLVGIMEDAPTMGLERAAKGYAVELTDDAKAKAVAFLEKLRHLPTEYFEAKVLRDVSPAEFQGAVVPDDVDPKALAYLRENIGEVRTYKAGDEADRAAKIGEFNNLFFQQARGSITLPEDLTKAPAVISLFKGANLSTFIHEAGHFFLEVQADLAARIQGQIDAGASVTDGEREIVADMNKLLAWFGVKGDMGLSALDIWHTMPLEEKRAHHEQFARGFEAHAFEGRAPSIELQGVFQKFRAWLVSVYKDLKALNVTLTDDVRGVMDRMLASTQAIQEAEAARRMGPLFKTAEEAGMSLDEFAAYHALATGATQSAINELQARGLRDMRWLANAKDKKLKELQAQYKTLRSGVRAEVRGEVMSQPVYRAWQFLTGKGDAQETAQTDAKAKQDPKALDVVEDSLFKAIAKLGGLSKDEAVSLWGVDPKEKIESGVFGTPVLRKSGGLSVDAMAARLTEVGYLLPDENGTHDVNALFEAFDSERRGSPVYSTWHEYQRPNDGAPVEPLPDHIAFGKLSTGALTEQYGTKEGGPLAKLQVLKMTSEARGIHPDVVAPRFGFSSGDEMIRALLDAEPPASVIEGMTDQRMLERYGDLGTLEGLTKAADRAIHNEARARFVATEIKALETGMRVRAPGATGRSTVDVLATVARQQAEAIVARTKVRDLRPGQYTAAEARAARAAEKAMLAGKTEDALAEKRHQIINLQAAKATMNAQDEMDKTVKYLRKFDSKAVRSNLPADYLAQIDMLLEKFDLSQQSGAAIDRTVALRTWVQSRLAAGEIPAISESLLAPAERRAYEAAINARDDQGNLVYPDDEERIKLLADAIQRGQVRPYQTLTVEELRGLRDTIKQIEHLGRLKDKLLTARDGQTYAATRDALVSTLVNNAKQSGKNTRTDNTLAGSWLEKVKQFGASHIKVATWARIFDGGQDNGAWWSTIIRPANDRASFETTRRAEATSRLMAILGPVLKDVALVEKIGSGKFFPELGTSLNWEERFTIACNFGNESNLQRLMGGGIAPTRTLVDPATGRAGSPGVKSLTMPQVQAVLRSLSAAEWQAVQGVWDHFETYRPEIAAKEMRVNGVEPEWIAARPFTVQTSDGQTLSMRGGYYPVVFDPRTNLKAQQHNDAQAAKDAMKASYSAATTRRSFTKARVEEVTGRPLLLNLRGLYSGTNDVIHDLAWHEWVIDMNKLMRSQALDEAIREHYGADVKKELTKWRDDIVAGSKRLDHGIENAAGWARKFTSSAALTYNVMSAMLQPLGITQSFSRVGTTWVAKGIGQYLSGPIEATQLVKEKSEFMRNRGRTLFRDINELRNRVEGQTTGRELMGRYGYYLTMQMQQTVDVPTWIGGYEKAIAAGHNEATAIALADQGVKDSQGGGEEVDQAGITRGGPLIKLFTAFYDFMNTQANVLYLAQATSKTKADAFMHFAMVGVATPILAAALKAALTPGDSGDWDEEHVLRTMIREGLANLFGMVAFGREFTGLIDKMMGTNKGVNYTGPTGLRIIPDTIKLSEQAAQGDLDDAFRKSFLNVLGDFSGIPAVQINRTITGAEALNAGDTQNPGALVFGYQKP